MPISDEVMQQFADYRKAKRKDTLGKVRQVVGGAAETMRTGASAVDTFAKRAPQYDTMSAQQKVEASTPILEEMAQDERGYYKENLNAKLEQFKQQQANYRAALNAYKSRYATMSANQRQAAQLQTRRLEREIALLDRQAEGIALASNLMEQGDLAQRVADTRQAALAELQPLVDSGKYTPEQAQKTVDLHVQDLFAAELATIGGEAAGDRVTSKEWSRKSPEGETTSGTSTSTSSGSARKVGGTPQQQVALKTIESLTGRPISDWVAMGPEGLEAANQILLAQMSDVLGTTSDKKVEWARRASATGGSDPAFDAVISAGLQGRQMAAQAQAPEIPGPGPEPGEPVEDFDNPELRDYQDSVLGIPVKQASTAQERMTQLLDLIEQYPEHPPLQQAKMQIMASPEFKQYKSARGLPDDDFAFRQMKRDAKRQRRAAIKDYRQKVREEDTPRAPSVPSTPVHGSVMRGPTEA